jgi:cytochrome oxidase assembly protein ShyY1
LVGVYRFLFRPKWLLFLAGCVVFAVACYFLGQWQLDRREQRSAQNDRITAARTAEPAAVRDVLRTDRAPTRGDRFQIVEAVGRYDTDNEYLVRGRTLQRRVGFYVLTPLNTSDGTALLVVRGWVPARSEGASVPPEVPAAPTGEVTVVGRVRASEQGALNESEVGRYSSVRRIDTARLGEAIGAPTYRGYVELVRQQPEPPDGLELIPAPPIESGPHLAYAVQWFLFGLLAFVGYGTYARREAQRRRAPEPVPIDA